METIHKFISPYLFDASNLSDPTLTVRSSPRGLSPRPEMMNGPKSTDGGHLILRDKEISQFVAVEPLAEKYLRPYVGAEEFLQNKKRSILFLAEASPQDLRDMPHVRSRMVKLRQYRADSQKPATKKLADYPTLLEGRNVPTISYLVVPQVSSERRE